MLYAVCDCNGNRTRTEIAFREGSQGRGSGRPSIHQYRRSRLFPGLDGL